MTHKPVVINVLSHEYHDDCHIPNSINIPTDELEEVMGNYNKNTEIIVYCAHVQCPASRNAWHILHDMGFVNVRAYEGGMREWKELGYPTEGTCSADYFSKELKSPLEEDEDVKTISAQDLRKKLEL